MGSTESLEKRIVSHNAGKTKTTKAYRPWKLLEFKVYNSRSEAVQAETFFKSHQQKELLKQKYKFGGMAKQ